MDHSKERRELARISRDSTAQVSASADSIAITRDHVTQSREAVGRSLRLLTETARAARQPPD